MNIDSQHLSYPQILQQLKPRVISFDEVFPVWSGKLWPARQSLIRPVSPIQIDLQYDPTILSYSPHFFGVYFQQKLVGVIGGYPTSDTLYRCRGLYVEPAFRGFNISQILFNEVVQAATKHGAQSIWTLPRKSAWPVYEKLGFYRITDWIEKGMEFGPNCVAKHELNRLRHV